MSDTTETTAGTERNEREWSSASLVVVVLVIELLVDVIPWFGGASFVSLAFSSELPFVVRISSLLSLFAGPIALVIAAALFRTRPTFAAGMVAAIAVVLGVRVVAALLETTQGWIWQTWMVLALQTLEVALLLLAASRARREEPRAS